jgi:hypothetical protein
MNLEQRELLALTSASIMIVVSIWYSIQLLRNKIETVIASWMLGTITLALSFGTYWTGAKHSFSGNAANFGAMVGCSMVLCVLLWLKFQGRVKIGITPFQKWCLGISAVIIVLWAVIVIGFRGTGDVPNILTQTLILLSYVMLYKRLWHAKENKESFVLWGGICLSSAIGLFPAIMSGEWQSITYCTLSVLRTAITVALMIRLELRARSLLATAQA